jgi:UDP-N-acetylmuramoylalanine--D-glutamate ligase
MIEVSSFKGEAVAVMGLARSGLTAAAALAAGGAFVWAWDDKEESRHQAERRGIPLVDLYSCDWEKVETLVLSPGIPHTFPKPHPVAEKAIAAGVEIVCDIDLLARAVPEARYIGITGTNGKSTTTALIGHILKRAGHKVQVGGNIGMPVLELARLDSDGAYVLELSSYQLERMPTMALDIAVLLNITPDHLDRHGSLEGYVDAKRRIFQHTKDGGVAIVSMEDPRSRGICMELMGEDKKRIVPISTVSRAAGGVYIADGVLIDDTEHGAESACDLREAPALPGRHNWQNAAAAYAVARLSGVPPQVIADALADFPGLAHRQEKIRTIGRVSYINDSKATNSDSTAKALACYKPIHWLAGGQFKEKTLGEVLDYLPHVRHAYLFGEAAAKFEGELANRVALTRHPNMADALASAHRAAQNEGEASIVLLSPACASFDQFKDFEDRGDQFRRMVGDLPGGSQ